MPQLMSYFKAVKSTAYELYQYCEIQRDMIFVLIRFINLFNSVFCMFGVHVDGVDAAKLNRLYF